jgi:hypothetical protein
MAQFISFINRQEAHMAAVVNIEWFRDQNGFSSMLQGIESRESVGKESLLKGLGLEAQADITRAAMLSPIISEVYQELSPPEMMIWKRFLPKSYRMEHGEWEEYRFDTIPDDVIAEIQTLKKSKVFDDLEIWTPEKALIDPLLVGVVDELYYLIARWGESLKSFEEIVEELLRRCVRGCITNRHIYAQLAPAVQEFLKHDFQRDPELHSYEIVPSVLKWHCHRSAVRVIKWARSRDRCEKSHVCRKCGAYSS